MFCGSLILIHWIEIYPVDSAIQLLNNWGQVKFTEPFGRTFSTNTSLTPHNIRCRLFFKSTGAPFFSKYGDLSARRVRSFRHNHCKEKYRQM